jgi:glyoxylase-like metal-dependent hydrolase (beta-lactamase superfamily II)
MMTPNIVTLPGGVKVGVRDWLSANHIFLHGETGRVMIDTGYLAHASVSRAYVNAAFGELALDLIVNTHVHSDHVGCNAHLQRWTGAHIAVPEAEREAIARWDPRALWFGYADQICERFTPQVFLKAGEQYWWGDLEWEAIATPGHDDGTLVFYNPLHKILISADALWENGMGFVVPKSWDALAATRARAALDTMAKLDVAIVVPGHGPPFTDFRRALDNAYSKLAAMEADDMRVARSISKGMFIYSTLAREGFDTATLPDYVQRIGCHRDLNAEFFKLTPEAHCEWLVAEAMKSGHFTLSGTMLLPKPI